MFIFSFLQAILHKNSSTFQLIRTIWISPHVSRESSPLLHRSCFQRWKFHSFCFSKPLQHDLHHIFNTIFTVCEGSLESGCTMRWFEEHYIQRVTRLLKILIGKVFMSVKIIYFFRKIGKSFFLSLTCINTFFEKINPISH